MAARKKSGVGRVARKKSGVGRAARMKSGVGRAARKKSGVGRAARRPPTVKGVETRARLLAVAVQLFDKQGFEQTTLREIARRAEVSLGLLYRYYEGKDALVVELYDQLSLEFEARAQGLPPGSWATRFVYLLEVSLGVLAPQRATLRALIGSLTVEPGHPLFVPGGQPSHGRVLGRFVEALRGASDAPADSDRLGKLLYHLHLMLVLGWLLDRSRGQRASHQLVARAKAFLPMISPFLASPALLALGQPLAELVELAVLGDNVAKAGRERSGTKP